MNGLLLVMFLNGFLPGDEQRMMDYELTTFICFKRTGTEQNRYLMEDLLTK